MHVKRNISVICNSFKKVLQFICFPTFKIKNPILSKLCFVSSVTSVMYTQFYTYTPE